MIAPTLPVPTIENPIEELLATVSASRLGTFHQCRLKFFFRYVLKLKKAKTPALHVGSSVHAVLQAWSLARWKKLVFDLAGLKSHFEKHWVESQIEERTRWNSDDPEAAAKQEAWALLEMYFEKTPVPPDERPEAVEVRVDADLAKHGLPVLVGIIDLVRQGGKIVDFKTSAQTPNPEKAGHLHEAQVNCYSLLYREATGKREWGVELHHLVMQVSVLTIYTIRGIKARLLAARQVRHEYRRTICLIIKFGLRSRAGRDNFTQSRPRRVAIT